MKRVMTLSNSIIQLSLPFLKNGYHYKSLVKLYEDKYQINFLDTDLDIIKSRITWVQRHEETRNFMNFYGV